jgi:hypothetical protein
MIATHTCSLGGCCTVISWLYSFVHRATDHLTYLNYIETWRDFAATWSLDYILLLASNHLLQQQQQQQQQVTLCNNLRFVTIVVGLHAHASRPAL